MKKSLFKNKRTVNNTFGEGVLGKIDFSEFVVLWTYKYPLDRLYREKHNLLFNSPEHKQVNLIDMIIEISQDVAVREAIFQEIEQQKDPTAKYHPGRGKFFKTTRRVSKVTKKEIDNAFDQIDIGDIKYDESGNIIL